LELTSKTLLKERQKGRDDLKENRKCYKIKEEALDCTLWRTFFLFFLKKKRGNGPVLNDVMTKISHNTRCKYEH
jgi:hypothetical protein